MPRLYQAPSYELWWDPHDGVFCLQSPGRVFEGVPAVVLVNQKKVRTVSGTDLVSGRISQETLHDEHGLGQIVNIHYLETAGITLTLRYPLISKSSICAFTDFDNKCRIRKYSCPSFFIALNARWYQSLGTSSRFFLQ